MKKSPTVPTIYGPVDVDLTVCDGPECTNCVQESYMVGWFTMSPQGMPVATMGNVLPDPMDFCSLDCLKRALDIMTG